MFDGFPIAILNPLSVVGLIVIIGWMYATGRMYFRHQVEELKAAHLREITNLKEVHAREIARLEEARQREIDDANHERSEWRVEARLNQQAVVELTDQNRAMLNAFGPTLTDFLQGLRRAGIGAHDGGDGE